MDEHVKEIFKTLADAADKTDLLTSGLGNKELELKDTRILCRLITLILIIICTAVILCDYFIF